jgi:hypothetical protein
MSAFNTQTPGKYPEGNLSLLQHGESLKTRTYNKCFLIANNGINNNKKFFSVSLPLFFSTCHSHIPLHHLFQTFPKLCDTGLHNGD